MTGCERCGRDHSGGGRYCPVCKAQIEAAEALEKAAEAQKRAAEAEERYWEEKKAKDEAERLRREEEEYSESLRREEEERKREDLRLFGRRWTCQRCGHSSIHAPPDRPFNCEVCGSRELIKEEI